LFLFLQYIKPAWYYNLAHKTNVPVFQEINGISEQDRALLTPADAYNTELAKQADYAYQALQKGIIPDKLKTKVDIQDLVVNNLKDNYRFIQRFFGWHKATYILLIRLFTLHNPIAELYAYLQSVGQTRINPFGQHKKHGAFLTFESQLLQEQPLVSVVIPTLNRYPYLKEVLVDLEKQTYKHFEVLICDQSDDLVKSFYHGWQLNIRLIEQKEKALWLARNTCICAAKGQYLALTEDDVKLPADWIENHLKCLEYFNTNISCGIFFAEGKQPSATQSYFRLSELFATGNTLIKKEVFEKTGLFDRQFEGQRMGDGEFGLRCLLHDEKLVLNPLAYCIDIKAPVGGLREMGSWDALRTSKVFAPRPMPSVLYYIRKYFDTKSALFYIVQNVPYSFIPYQFKHSRVFKIAALLFFPAFLPLMIIVVAKSWREATKKLRQGPLIPTLK
jgi:glycosyltransferase involved in cell wall biosynthesis